MDTHRAVRLIGFVVLTFNAAVPVSQVPASGILSTFLEHKTCLPPANTAVRRLEATNRRFHKQAWLDAKTAFDPERGLTFEVLQEGGSGLIRSRVLRAALAAEVSAFRDDPQTIAIVPENYEIAEEGTTPDGLVTLRVKARRKEQMLINGVVLVTPGDARVVRIEGRLARNPSFWVTRVDVVRTYELINGFNMPVEVRSKADVRMFGASEFRMQIRYDSVAGLPVAPDDGSSVPPSD